MKVHGQGIIDIAQIISAIAQSIIAIALFESVPSLLKKTKRYIVYTTVYPPLHSERGEGVIEAVKRKKKGYEGIKKNKENVKPENIN